MPPTKAVELEAKFNNLDYSKDLLLRELELNICSVHNELEELQKLYFKHRGSRYDV